MDFHRTAILVLASLSSVLLNAAPATAQVLYAPQDCGVKNMKLLVQNTTATAQPFWVQVYEKEMVNEIRVDVEAGAWTSFEGSTWLQPGQTMTVKVPSTALRFTMSCGALLRMTPFSSPRWEFDLSREPGPLRLLMQNLAQGAQDIELAYLDAQGARLYDLQLSMGDMMQTTSTDLYPPEGTAKLVLEAKGRVNPALLNARTGRQLLARTFPPAKVPTDAAKKYFVLSNGAGDESFVIGLDDPALIAQARTFIKQGLAKLLVADIEPALDRSENRNYSLPDRSPWSWKVSKVLRFNDLGSLACDGSPSQIEEFFPRWMNPANRHICFWRYHLKRELLESEVRTGILTEEMP